MRLKIIFFPLVLSVSVIISIWYIWPTIQDIISKQEEVKNSQEILNATLNRKKNADLLRLALDENKEKENFVLNFLPFSREEEKIVNGMDYVATSSGVSLVNFAFLNKSEKPVPPSVSSENPPIMASTAPDSAVKFDMAKISIAGQYSGIKMFLDQIHSLNMLNKINSISISKVENPKSENESSTPSNTLIANIEINFGYLPNQHVNTNIKENLDIFSRSSFDFVPYTELIKLTTKQTPAVVEGQKGKENPFF